MINTFLAILLAGYAIGVLSLAWNVWRTKSLINEDAAIHPDTRVPVPAPSLDVVVPVKDEQDNIAATIHALLEQTYPNFNVHVVNDRSTDGTAAVIQSIQDHHPRVHRLDIRELPPGLFGKPHALHELAPRLTADILLFIDSDMRVKPGCFAAVVNHMTANKLDWLAAIGEPDVSMFWERLLLPIFGAMAYAWFDPRKINDPTRPEAIGCGFTAVRRERYFEIGGHGSIMDRYDEDSAIVRRAKSFGHRFNYALAPSLYWVRFYGDLRRTIRGFSRTLVGGLKTLPRFYITVQALIFVSLLPYLLIPALVIFNHYNVALPWMGAWAAFSVLHLVVSNALLALIYRGANQPLRLALLHPLGSIVAIWVCIVGAIDLKRRRPVTWRGTTYAGASTPAPPAGKEPAEIS